MAEHSSKRPKPYRPKSQSAPKTEQVIVEAVLRSVWYLVKALFSWPGRKSKPVNAIRAQRHKIQEQWEMVERHLLQATTKGLAVTEADKLLDASLQVKGLAGESMAERLKAAQNLFSPSLYQEIWEAHKLRNSLAHEVGATVTSSQALRAVQTIRQALYHLNIFS